MPGLPESIEDLDGPLYVVTHPREFGLDEWRTAILSCLAGEHGDEARELVHSLARYCGAAIPREWGG